MGLPRYLEEKFKMFLKGEMDYKFYIQFGVILLAVIKDLSFYEYQEYSTMDKQERESTPNPKFALYLKKKHSGKRELKSNEAFVSACTCAEGEEGFEFLNTSNMIAQKYLYKRAFKRMFYHNYKLPEYVYSGIEPFVRFKWQLPSGKMFVKNVLRCESDVLDKYVRYKWIQNINAKKDREDYEKVEIKWFLFWEKRNGEWIKIINKLQCNRYFAERAEELSNAKATREYNLIMQKEEIDKIRNIEQGRVFSGRLRHMILERDNFKCVLCGRGVPEGAVLEVDHIQEWIDGGKTTYDNGQTVCSDCNKGKHHAKKFNNKVSQLKKAVSE